MRLTVLATSGRSTTILLNWLHDRGFRDVSVILEDPVPRSAMIRFRIRKLGLWTAFGQILFQAMVVPILSRRAVRRLNNVMAEHGLRNDAPTMDHVIQVPTVNGDQAVAYLRESAPDVVLVSGTRILRHNVLTSVVCPFLNIHAGITPKYRGVHGGYWALRENDAEDFGATIHIVDEGVDTGKVLAHCRTTPTADDSFATYPLLQQAACFPTLETLLSEPEQLSEVQQSACKTHCDIGRQWFHPTLWQYLAGLMRGIS